MCGLHIPAHSAVQPSNPIPSFCVLLRCARNHDGSFDLPPGTTTLSPWKAAAMRVLLHPRSRVQDVDRCAHTSIQVLQHSGTSCARENKYPYGFVETRKDSLNPLIANYPHANSSAFALSRHFARHGTRMHARKVSFSAPKVACRRVPADIRLKIVFRHLLPTAREALGSRIQASRYSIVDSLPGTTVRVALHCVACLKRSVTVPVPVSKMHP